MKKISRSKKFILFLPIILVLIASIFLFINAAGAQQQTVQQPAGQPAGNHQTGHSAELVVKKEVNWSKNIAAALSVAVGCLAAGIAVAQVGSAAIGAISEKPEMFGRALTFVGLSEGIAIWGLIIAILILYA